MEQPPKKGNNFLKKVTRGITFGALALGLSNKADATIANPGDSTKKNIPIVANDAKDFEGNIDKAPEKVEIKIANYFETDKADISPENIQEITKLISTYIGSLNKDNVNQFLSSAPELNVSCDPRNTNTYENGNRGLAQARAEKIQKIIKEIISKYDFSKSGLSTEEIEHVIKNFSNLHFNIPESGVIDYHLVINPKTNAPFTDAEWTELNKSGITSAILEVYKDMRFVNLKLAILNSEKGETHIETNGNVFDTKGFEEAYLFFDKSPSMERHKRDLKKYLLTATELDIPVHVIGFTDEADAAFEAKNLKEGAEAIEKMKTVQKTVELGIDVTIQKLQEKKDDKKAIALIVTDEELQNVTREKLDTMTLLSKEKNIKFIFLMMLDGKELKLSLDGVKAAFNQKYEKMGRDEDIENTKKGISVLQKYLKQYEQDLAVETDKKKHKKFEENIKEKRNEIAVLENRLQGLSKINLDNLADFADVEKSKLEYYATQPDYSKKPNTVMYPGTDNSSSGANK